MRIFVDMNIVFVLLFAIALTAAVVAFMLYRSRGEQTARLTQENELLREENLRQKDAFANEQRARVEADTLRNTTSSRLSTAEQELSALREKHLNQSRELASLQASSQAEIQKLREQNATDRAAELEAREKQEEQFRQQFKLLSTKILDEQSAKFQENNKESIDVLLKPFRDNITEFRKRVEEIHTTQTSQRGELKAELKNLMDLNKRITTETTNLTNALKGNSKVQGDWGEMLLETILDNSSLLKGIHYETQYNVKDEEGNNLRPDVVLHLPEEKNIIIDSKVSLTAFVAYTSAESEEERQIHLKKHLESVRQHVTELGRKEYQRLMKSPDFVIMFIPNEPAFLTALQSDPSIWSDAYEKKVIISSPTNLFALLKMVADLWKYNDQDKNTKRIAETANKLYEQVVRFASSLEAVGSALGKAQAAYDDAQKRLSTGNNNIVRLGEGLRKTASLQSKQHFSKALLEADDNEADDTDEILLTENTNDHEE